MALDIGRGSGFDFSNLDEITEEEKGTSFLRALKDRGPMYQLWCNELIADYANPRWAKLRTAGTRHCDAGGYAYYSQPDFLLWSVNNLPSYMLLGWETGVRNEFFALWRHGLNLAQTMEIVMFAQGYAGMRGLGHVYRAVGDFLPVYKTEGQIPTQWPEGWEADPDAFKSGLDLSTSDLSDQDRKNLEGWYEKNIGYVPKSIAFGIKHHPEFVKVNRAKWESAITTLPKQVAPYIMIKLNLHTNNVQGIREGTLLAKSWGVKKKYIRQMIAGTVANFANLEGYYAPAEAIDDIFDSMD